MDKRDKAIIKLLGMIAGQLAVIATNLAFSNTDKIAFGARKEDMMMHTSKVMSSIIDKINKVVEEATDDR